MAKKRIAFIVAIPGSVRSFLAEIIKQLVENKVYLPASSSQLLGTSTDVRHSEDGGCL